METSPRPWGRQEQHTRFNVRCQKHPHIRGENALSKTLAAGCRETSPRPWGRRNRRAVRSNALRNIPTPVGKTDNHKSSQSRKHPHARGEDLIIVASGRQDAETSPRLWGRPDSQTLLNETNGNIPTPVGKTPDPCKNPQILKKHPHACGEDFRSEELPTDVLETSPRLWGRLTLATVSRIGFGNIPTPVGKTLLVVRKFFKHKKHPHACGEDFWGTALHELAHETSPRLWGRLAFEQRERFCLGNIPTPVGKT